MKIESLYRLSSEDWKILETQYAESFGPTFELVTENKGSLAESQAVYLESFVYYSQMLELHGFDLHVQSAEILYSFSRKLWIQKLRKRLVDINFVKHTRHFFDMEDAFNEIDSIRDKSEKTALKLAEIGEPSRTLLLECIGRRKDIEESGSRLGYADPDRAMLQIVKGLKRLIELLDSKRIDLKDELIGKMVKEIIDPKHSRTDEGYSTAELVDKTIVARAVALLRSYVIRNERMQLLKELQVRVIPSIEIIHDKGTETKSKAMKPILMAAASALAVVFISGLTALGVVGINSSRADDIEVISDSAMVEAPIPAPVFIESSATAFQINQSGLLITAAEAVAGQTEIDLHDKTENRTIKAKVCFVDRALNVAIIQSEGVDLEPILYRFSPDDAKIGQPVYTLASEDDAFIYQQAYIASSTTNQLGRIKVDQAIPGTPIWSEQGQLIGMVSSSTPPAATDKLSTIVHVSLMKELLDRWSNQSGSTLNLTTRNKLFYHDRTQQIEQIKPHLFEITYLQEKKETL